MRPATDCPPARWSITGRSSSARAFRFSVCAPVASMPYATASRYSSFVVRRREATIPAMFRKNAAAMSGRSRCTLAKLCRERTRNSLASVVRAVALRLAPSMKLISPITSPGPNEASERSTSPRMFLKMSTRPLWTMNSESPGSFSRKSSSPPTRFRSSQAFRTTSASSEVSSANRRQRFSFPSSATHRASHGLREDRKLSGVKHEPCVDGAMCGNRQPVSLGAPDHGTAEPRQLEAASAQHVLCHRGEHAGGQRVHHLELLLRERVVDARALRARDRDGLAQGVEQHRARRRMGADFADGFAGQRGHAAERGEEDELLPGDAADVVAG